MEFFKTRCTQCGIVDHPIDYYAHDEFSYEDNCEECGTRLPNVDSDALDAVADVFAGAIDNAMTWFE